MGDNVPQARTALDLSIYPRPNVAVDVVLITICQGRLLTLLVRRS